MEPTRFCVEFTQHFDGEVDVHALDIWPWERRHHAPFPAKYRVTSSPRSAARAICSAEGLRLLVFFMVLPAAIQTAIGLSTQDCDQRERALLHQIWLLRDVERVHVLDLPVDEASLGGTRHQAVEHLQGDALVHVHRRRALEPDAELGSLRIISDLRNIAALHGGHLGHLDRVYPPGIQSGRMATSLLPWLLPSGPVHEAALGASEVFDRRSTDRRRRRSADEHAGRGRLVALARVVHCPEPVLPSLSIVIPAYGEAASLALGAPAPRLPTPPDVEQ